MFRRIFFFAFLAMPGVAQIITSVRGAVASDELLTGNHLVVNLIESVTRKAIDRAFVAGDGTFEFRNVPTGLYTVELAVSSGDPILSTTVSLNTSGDRCRRRSLLARPGRCPSASCNILSRRNRNECSRLRKRLRRRASI